MLIVNIICMNALQHQYRSLLEPILLLVVGLFIGLLVYAVMSPMYQVFQMI